MKKTIRVVLLLLFGLITHSIYANQSNIPFLFSPSYLTSGELTVQVGYFGAHQGATQDIGINGLIGDRFTVTDHWDQNVLVGVGYYLNGYNRNWFSLQYGINAFYLAHTAVKGVIIQEQEFTNLAYQYSVNNWPIYLATKAIFKPFGDRYNITFDLGIGPNIIQAGNVVESSLDGVTVPDHAFTGKTTAAFSVTAGVGLRFNNLFGRVPYVGCLPLEVGYRYFYLGKGYFNKTTNQLINTLNTGSSYANAVVVSTSF